MQMNKEEKTSIVILYLNEQRQLKYIIIWQMAKPKKKKKHQHRTKDKEYNKTHVRLL